jgi:hypothetical protein
VNTRGFCIISALTPLTQSNRQVRQPIETRSVGCWKHYERHLQPLMAALREQQSLMKLAQRLRLTRMNLCPEIGHEDDCFDHSPYRGRFDRLHEQQRAGIG